MDIKYFDNSATTRIKDEVLEEMFPYLSIEYGNPSSVYSIGRKARKAVQEARNKVASLINCKPYEIYFTSCGSESDNMALKGLSYAQMYKKSGKNHIITSKIEHPAIMNTCKALEKQGFKITYVDVDKEGFVNLNTLENAITDKAFLISIMYANNEIGTIEPVDEIAKIAHRHNILFHTDAVQAVGNIKIDVQKSNIDMLSLSGHKIYAPKGIGALYVKKGIEFERFLDGGHQERDKRSGTENVAEIVALGKACELAEKDLEQYQRKLIDLRDYFISSIKNRIPNLKINGSMEKRLPGNCHLTFEDIESGDLLLRLDELGICASGGSACSSGDNSISYVLAAIGLPSNLAKGALRITFGDYNTIEEVDFLLDALEKIINK